MSAISNLTTSSHGVSSSIRYSDTLTSTFAINSRVSWLNRVMSFPESKSLLLLVFFFFFLDEKKEFHNSYIALSY